MTSRERVLRAVNHQEVDRQPVDFGGTVVTCMDKAAHERLLRHLGMDGDTGPIIDYSMGTTAPGEALQRRMGSDVRRLGMNVTPPDIVNDEYQDGFGMILRRAKPHLYFDTIHHPLAEADIADLDAMRMPDPDNPALYHGLKDRAKDLFDHSPYALFADFGVPGFFETSQKLRGYEQFYCDLLLEKEFLFALWDRLLELQKRFFKNYLSQVAPCAFAVGYADDLGMQDRPQISPELYREMLKPYHAMIFSYIHEFGVKVMLHSCGAISPLIDDLIEAGVDILNPVQTSAENMDVGALKARFGERVCFWGGIDEQHILPHGTEQAVRAEVRRVSAALGVRGGYVMAPAHNVQADTPPENLLALYDEASKLKR
jgi:uroporphyrinogen decarboxylase